MFKNDIQGVTSAIDQFLDQLADGYSSDPEIRSFVVPLRVVLLAQKLSRNDTQSLITYLSNLLEPANNYTLFKIAAEIITRTNQVWMLQRRSLLFFMQLKQQCSRLPITHSGANGYNQLLGTLKDYSDPMVSNLFVKAHHIDAITEMIELQQQLPTDVFHKLHNWIMESRVDIYAIVSQLRHAHLKWIDVQAENKQLHHTLNHAFEIRVRSMLLSDALNLFPNHATDPLVYFVRKVIKFAIECHDIEQQNLGAHATPELASADYVENWLILNLDPIPPAHIQALIRYLVRQVIVLGTTMIFGRTRTLDLWELFGVFTDTLLQARVAVMDPSNSDWIKKIQAMGIITGVCDKNPAAFYKVVENKYLQMETNTSRNLKEHYPELILDNFFSSEWFQPYYDIPATAINQEAFFITMVPHLCMRAEIAMQSEVKRLALSFMSFVKTCKEKLKELTNYEAEQVMQVDYDAFLEFFGREFENQEIAEVVIALFFSNIMKEQQFCLSQVGGLQSAVTKLQKNGFLDEQGKIKLHSIDDELDIPIAAEPVKSSKFWLCLFDCSKSVQVQPQQLTRENNSRRLSAPLFIKADVPRIDAQNLEGLHEFFFSLQKPEQERLVQELVLNVILQDGSLYALAPNLDPDIDKSSPINNSNRNSVRGNRARSFSSKLTRIDEGEILEINTQRVTIA